jgi:hypothetical protein
MECAVGDDDATFEVGDVRERLEIVPHVVAEDALRPAERLSRDPAESLISKPSDCDQVVVPDDADCVQSADEVYALVGMWPVADEIARDDVPVDGGWSNRT